MKRYIRSACICILLFVAAICLAFGYAHGAEVIASGSCGTSARWSLDGDGTLTVSGSGYMDDYMTVNINGWNYAPWHSYNSLIKSVVIEEGIGGIGSCAFRECRNLESLVMPDSLIYANEYAFYHCSSLKDITWGKGLTFLGWDSFNGCYSLESVILPEGFTIMERDVFCHCTALEEVSFPDSIRSIGYDVLYDTPFYYNESNWEDDVLYAGHMLIEARMSGTESYVVREGTITIADYAFSDREGLILIAMPNSLRHIGECAFTRCYDLRQAPVPASVESIGGHAFTDTAIFNNENNWKNGILYAGCALADARLDITGAYIQSGTTVIADWAFLDCDALKAITVPQSVKHIGVLSVSGCKALKDVYYTGTEEEWNAIDIDSSNDSLGKAAKHFGAIAMKIAVYSTNRALCIQPGEAFDLGFCLYDPGSDKIDPDWQQMALVLSNTEVLSFSEYKETEYGYSVTITGLQTGISDLIVTDTETGISTTVRITVRDEYAQGRSFPIEALPTFYPDVWRDNKIETNIYNMGGLYVNNYSCSRRDKVYSVSFDVYNSCCHHGAVDVFDAQGHWIGMEEIEKFGNTATSLYKVGEQAFSFIGDIVTGEMLTYEQNSFAQKTHIEIEVPEGGYFRICSNTLVSPGVYCINCGELLFTMATRVIDGLKPDNDMKEGFGVLLRGEIMKDPDIREELLKAFTDTGKNVLFGFLRELDEESFEHQMADFTRIYMNVIEKYVDWKHCLELATGFGEKALYKAMGPAGLTMEGLFKFAAALNDLEQLTDLRESVHFTYASVYTPTCGSRVTQNGVTFDTEGNVDSEAIAQVFEVYGVETGLGEVDSRVYNICFVKNDQTVQPSGLVQVSIPVPNGFDPSSCMIFRQKENGAWEEIPCELQDGFLVFETDHFSLYAVTGTPAALTIDSMPVLQDYRPGEILDTEGLRLSLGGETIDSGYICNPCVLSETGEQTITVRYGAAETTFTVLVMDIPYGMPMAQKKEGKLHYSAETGRAGGTAYILAASYDEDGRFLGLTMQEVPRNGICSGEIEIVEDADNYKIFQTDIALSPMCVNWFGGE
ncbi:MAG: leucine-rich repeat domain-containing protein [Clostridia bacterium]|nr:leucine-rich repeat domain-containing protein [Clostridia bacterium]